MERREASALSLEPFRALQRNNPSVKYEYFDGYVYATAGGSRRYLRLGARSN